MELFDTNSLEWTHLLGDENFDYPIDYWSAVPSAREDGHVDLLFRWEPNSYCHFHRHLVDTTSTVLRGELTVIDMEQGKEVARRTRSAGDYAHKPAGDVHMERAGPEGATVLFNLYAPDGRLFDMLDSQENTLLTVTIDNLLSGELGS